MKTVDRQTVFLAPRYRDAWAAVAFLERCFGFERRAIHEGSDGSVAHGELGLGNACYGLSSAGGVIDPRNPWTTVRSGLYVALADAAAVDTHYARASAAGAEVAMPIEDTDYGSHQYSVWDSEHRLWCFGTYTYAPVGDIALHVRLRYPDRRAAIDWLSRAFGLAPVEANPAASPDRPIALRDDGVAVWLEPATTTEDWGSQWHAAHVVVEDVAGHFLRAQREGARITRALTQADNGGEFYCAVDPEGYAWTFASSLPGS
jgi:uncharacterized glyoxalase superfamily protein PhnB